ncbi:MAG: tryptophan-rich sensory protein [Armatimonadetes bacterium]|nr:tryptophan-rich sensory protein [Anaerolineae bacterium]
MNRDIVRQFVNIVALIFTLVINVLAQLEVGGIGVANSAVLANRYPDLYYFPANQAFSIWGIIYSFLIAFTIYQALPSQRANPLLRRLGYWFPVTALFNTAWLASFQYEQFALSMVMMLALLGSLIVVYLRLGIGRTTVSLLEKLVIHVPFSLYLGWITAATVTNASYVLRDANWGGFGIASEVWGVVLLAVTGILGIAMLLRHRDVAYGLVIVWATYWIASRHSDVQIIAVAALGIAIVMLLGSLISFGLSLRNTAALRSAAA